MFHLKGAAQRNNTSSADNRHVKMYTLPDEKRKWVLRAILLVNLQKMHTILKDGENE